MMITEKALVKIWSQYASGAFSNGMIGDTLHLGLMIPKAAPR
jgi:hypothetical protein